MPPIPRFQPPLIPRGFDGLTGGGRGAVVERIVEAVALSCGGLERAAEGTRCGNIQFSHQRIFVLLLHDEAVMDTKNSNPSIYQSTDCNLSNLAVDVHEPDALIREQAVF